MNEPSLNQKEKLYVPVFKDPDIQQEPTGLEVKADATVIWHLLKPFVCFSDYFFFLNNELWHYLHCLTFFFIRLFHASFKTISPELMSSFMEIHSSILLHGAELITSDSDT